MTNSIQSYVVDNTLTFSFPQGFEVEKCDDWTFYRNQFSKVRQDKGKGICSMDLLALAPNKTLWLIEAKDYRVHKRTKNIEPWLELRNKVTDTLAMLMPASCNAVNQEKIFAMASVKAKKLRIVLHFEQPRIHSKLFPRDFDLDDIQKKLKLYIKCIDANPIVMDIASKPASIPWEVQ